MLIVMAIIGIITMVVITSQGAFNKSLILSNAAYDTALALRSAESYGIASRLVPGSLQTNSGYGLHFDSRQASSFIFFADSNPPPDQNHCYGIPIGGPSAPDAKSGDCIYTSSGSSKDTLLQTYKLNNRITISKICAMVGGSSPATYCAPSPGNGPLVLDVTFIRPNPEAFMTMNGAYDASRPVIAGCIALRSALGTERYVLVNQTGQINANAASCP